MSIIYQIGLSIHCLVFKNFELNNSVITEGGSCSIDGKKRKILGGVP
jgi:hypothetical protein